MASAEASSKMLKKRLTLHEKVLEALASNTTSKGLTLKGIKNLIIGKYPEMEENFSNKRLHKAMTKGLESDLIKRKSTEDSGFKGYFLLNRVMAEKEKKKKATKPAKALDTEKQDKAKTKTSQKKEKSVNSGTTVKKSEAKVKISKPKTTASPKTKTAKRPLTPKAAISNKLVARKRESVANGTPKISKADKAGKRAKTSSVKRLLK